MLVIFCTIVLFLETWSIWYIIVHVRVPCMVKVNFLHKIIAECISFNLCRRHQEFVGPTLMKFERGQGGRPTSWPSYLGIFWELENKKWEVQSLGTHKIHILKSSFLLTKFLNAKTISAWLSMKLSATIMCLWHTGAIHDRVRNWGTLTLIHISELITVT